MNCFVTQKTVVVGSIFLLSEFVLTTPEESKAWKQLFPYFHAPRIPEYPEVLKAEKTLQ